MVKFYIDTMILYGIWWWCQIFPVDTLNFLFVSVQKCLVGVLDTATLEKCTTLEKLTEACQLALVTANKKKGAKKLGDPPFPLLSNIYLNSEIAENLSCLPPHHTVFCSPALPCERCVAG